MNIILIYEDITSHTTMIVRDKGGGLNYLSRTDDIDSTIYNLAINCRLNSSPSATKNKGKLLHIVGTEVDRRECMLSLHKRGVNLNQIRDLKELVTIVHGESDEQ